MNAKVREEIEKAAKERAFGSMQAFYFLEGATFGYNLALQHASVLREALNKLERESTGFLSMANRHDHGNTNMKVMQHWIDNAREALEQFDKLTKETKETV